MKQGVREGDIAWTRTDTDGYGRYIDENDGLPRWKLPQKCLRPWGLRWEYIKEAITEFYPVYGARFTAERLGLPSSRAEQVMKLASLHGVRITEEGWRKVRAEGGLRRRRIFKMERARVMGGMPQLTGLRIGRGGKVFPHKLYGLRNRLVTIYGYYYCEGDTMTLLYDNETKRRLPGAVGSRGYTEDEVTRMYGITFERVDDDEGQEHPTLSNVTMLDTE